MAGGGAVVGVTGRSAAAAPVTEQLNMIASPTWIVFCCQINRPLIIVSLAINQSSQTRAERREALGREGNEDRTVEKLVQVLCARYKNHTRVRTRGDPRARAPWQARPAKRLVIRIISVAGAMVALDNLPARPAKSRR